jgi:hypothetical protein
MANQPTVFRLPSTSVDYSIVLLIDGEKFPCRLQWNWRAGDWRISIHDLEGNSIATSRRISPGGVVARMPNGGLFASGPDPYNMEDLGDLLQLVYYSDDAVRDAFTDTLEFDPVPSLVY